ncbi:GntR family transcriptional regulator [Paracoccus sp. Z330]|uniref:GntR family transcriptional regulator n=1 Tax=Paracoccus onchidii TaxID=3017813 RepID=A0ABT4ZD59_9RHOB|nr:GntR family transcriptional regulator [Paracoccus onchidii]MDB6177288.1 GntR family transcriptional regulator [Paracoccus onchidii]
MEGEAKNTRLLAQPLYKRAEVEMTNRIATGRWPAGYQLANEFALADEFGVSQGTIRKALVAMERRGLLMRSPGRGTMVCKTTQEESLFAFFRLRNESGEMVIPTPAREEISSGDPTSREIEVLGPDCRQVIRLNRLRQNGGTPFVVERMSFDVATCDGMVEDLPLPGSLYPYLHERFGLMIMTVSESITAAVADDDLAAALEVETGAPLLKVVRVARDLSDRKVELRDSFYRTDFASYQIELARS